jgi:hypothetical protein
MSISNYILFVTTIISWITIKKVKGSPLVYLPFYLTYACLLEFGAHTIASYSFIGEGNTWWYNFGINIELLFYFYIYYMFLKNARHKKSVIYLGIIYETYFLYNVFIGETWNSYQTFPLTLGSVFLIILIFIFLLEMFQSNRILHTRKYLIFWISIGLLFYNIIPIPLFVIRSIIPLTESNYLMIIQYIANIIMYLLFIYGFIWSSMKYK